MCDRIKRLMAALLAAVLLVAGAPLQAAAATAGTVGSSVNYSLSDSGALTITGTGATYAYDYYHKYSPFYKNQNVKALTVGQGVTELGAALFYGCGALTLVTLPSSLTEIGWYAFENCTALTQIVIPEGVTVINVNAFAGCKALTKVTLPSTVTKIAVDAFAKCENLSEVTFNGTVSQWNQVQVASGNTVLLAAMPEAYQGRNGQLGDQIYYTIDANGNMAVTGSGEMWDFAKCPLLFEQADALCTVTVGQGITSLGNHFLKGCPNLTAVTLPAGLTRMGQNAFYNCGSLTQINLPEGLTEIEDGVFYACKDLTEITLPAGLTRIGEYAFFYTGLTEINLPETVTALGKNVFQGCKDLTAVTLPKHLTAIPTYAFASCTALAEVAMSDEVESIGAYAFDGCTALGAIHIPDSVHTLGTGVFYGCKNLTAVTLPKTMDAMGENIFYGCEKLREVTLPAGITAIGKYSFFGCKALEDVTIPNTVKIIDTAAFGNCARLTSVYVPGGVTTIGGSAFNACTLLADITLPFTLTAIEAQAFAKCDRLQYIFFTGSQSQWNGVNVSVNSGIPATVHMVYNACTHRYIAKKVKATCTADGYTVYTCERCGDSYTTQQPATGHTLSDWQYLQVPTVTQPGVLIKICVVCQEEQERMTLPVLPPNAVTGVTLSTEECTLQVGQSQTLTATVLPHTAVNKALLWQSSDPTVVSVTDGVLTPKKHGVAVVTVETADGGYKDFCLVRVESLLPIGGTVIDNENSLIYGLPVGGAEITACLAPTDQRVTLQYSAPAFATGTAVELVQDGQVIDRFTVVIFGDVDGDGFYDGQDAFLVSCMVAGLLTSTQVEPWVWAAADCNHDGVIDEKDVALLRRAGLLLGQVDQSATQEELLANEDYQAYLTMIAQSPEQSGTAQEGGGWFAMAQWLFLIFLGILKRLVAFIPFI